MDSIDSEIREALHRKVLKAHHKSSSTIIVDELGLAHGKNRIDIAVLNGHLHGYEIKSAKDTLTRLPVQLNQYRKSLQKLTIVAAPNHLHDVLSITPKWSGIILAQKGPRGGISFTTVRKATINPEVDSVALAHLLWRKEAVELLTRFGIPEKELNKPRNQLYEIIANETSLKELVSWIKEKFMARETWRAGLQPA